VTDEAATTKLVGPSVASAPPLPTHCVGKPTKFMWATVGPTSGIGTIVALNGALVLGGVILFGGFLLSMTAGAVLSAREIRQFNRELADIAQRMANGELARAREFYWAWSSRSGVAEIATLARHNLAFTMIRQGEHEHAIAILLDNQQHYAAHLTRMQLAPTSAADLAFAHALAGKLEEAERWISIANGLKAPRNRTFTAMAAWARGAIEVRAGRAEAAAKLLEDAWRHAEANFTGSNLRPMRVLRAFAIASTGSRQAGVAEQMIEGIKPQFPEEFAFLATAWPELGTFLDAHVLR